MRRPRPLLDARVPAFAALIIARDFGPQLEAKAQALSGSPDETNQQAAREIREALAFMREAAAQAAARLHPAPGTSANGSAEVPAGGAGAALVVESSSPDQMSAREVAEAVRLSPRWVRMLCEHGPLRATKRGGVWWISREDLQEYLDTRERPPA